MCECVVVKYNLIQHTSFLTFVSHSCQVVPSLSSSFSSLQYQTLTRSVYHGNTPSLQAVLYSLPVDTHHMYVHRLQGCPNSCCHGYLLSRCFLECLSLLVLSSEEEEEELLKVTIGFRRCEECPPLPSQCMILSRNQAPPQLM